MHLYLLWLILLLGFSCSACEGASQNPFIHKPMDVAAVAPGVLSSAGVISSADHLTEILYRAKQPSHGMIAPKGKLTEELMEKTLTRAGLSRSGKWIQGTPDRIGNKGIDGLFFKTDKSGYIRDLYIMEAKYGSSRLQVTRSGRQMSEQWISERLLRTAKMYRKLANDIRSANVSRVGGLAKSRAANKIFVPLRNGQSAVIWKANEGTMRFFCPDKSVTWQEIEKQAKRTSIYLAGAAENKFTYRSGIFRYDGIGKQHRITIVRWDPKNLGIKIKEASITGTFQELPKTWQNALRRTFIEQFVDMGFSGADARKLARLACEDPAFYRTMTREPRYTPLAGLNRHLAYSMLGSGVFVVTLDAATQAFDDGKIDVARTVRTGAVGSLAAISGHYTGSQINALLMGTNTGRNMLAYCATRALPAPIIATSLGALGGGLIATGVFAYGGYFFGLHDLSTANTQLIIGSSGVLATAVFYAGTMAYVTAFGTASTGAAISSLSGAAATNAALAYIGGGAISAGGWGVTGGAVILGASGLVVGVVAVVVVSYGWQAWQASKEEALIRGRIRILKDLALDWSEPYYVYVADI